MSKVRNTARSLFVSVPGFWSDESFQQKQGNCAYFKRTFWCFTQLALYTYDILKDQQIHFGFMDVILLHSGRQYVSATHVAIFMVERERIQVQIILCLDDSTVYKSFAGLLIHFMHLIIARNMEHTKPINAQQIKSIYAYKNKKNPHLKRTPHLVQQNV